MTKVVNLVLIADVVTNKYRRSDLKKKTQVVNRRAGSDRATRAVTIVLGKNDEIPQRGYTVSVEF